MSSSGKHLRFGHFGEFLQICNKLANGKVGVEVFVIVLTSSLKEILGPNEVDMMVKDIEKHPLRHLMNAMKLIKKLDYRRAKKAQELTAASDKLAECQETIINLGNTSPLPNENNNQRVSLLDKMITEDPTGAPRSQIQRFLVLSQGVKDEEDEEALVNFLSIVPNKKNNNGGDSEKIVLEKEEK
ncbi:hypothetical protein E3N88_02527 [Mikania micrantha]|uniref:Uncharacterized protein n=1 Tax=Mikania micrantha TaxID=192012 RepID=A0A5N6Q607_9ASTR|nr:hypothetical protein E3N88_02527 [Mikania micrantha]